MASKAYRENYNLIDWSKPLPELPPKEFVAPTRSSLTAPYVAGDTIEPTRSMATGEMFTSKSKLRATYRPNGNPNGNRYIEVGNEQLKAAPKPKPDRKAINESVEKAFAKAGIS